MINFKKNKKKKKNGYFTYSRYNNYINPKQYRLQPVWARQLLLQMHYYTFSLCLLKYFCLTVYTFLAYFKSFYTCEKVYNPTET